MRIWPFSGVRSVYLLRERLRDARREIVRLEADLAAKTALLERMAERLTVIQADPNNYARYDIDRNTTDGERRLRSFQASEVARDQQGLTELISQVV